MTRKTLNQNLKMLFAAHHYVWKSKEAKTIADVVNVKQGRLQRWMQTDEWLELVAYWRGNPRSLEGDLGLAEKLWSQMIEFEEHTSPAEYPNATFSDGRVHSEPIAEFIKNNALEMLQYKPNILIPEPFCIDGISNEQIEARIAEERAFGYTPMKFEQQYLQGYYWWLYPNWDRGVFSKVFARANMFGNLVCGAGEKTHLVCIENGRFVLSRNVSENAVLASDERLLVCL